MKSSKSSIWLPLAALLCFCLLASACKNGTPPTAKDCHGDVYIESEDVVRVSPSPRLAYTDGYTYAWGSPPYGLEVTNDGEVDMRIYSAANALLAKYTIYAATTTQGSATVKEWNGLKTVTFNAGNFIVEDKKSQDICRLDLIAGGVKISAVGTTYLITVRPAIGEVKVAVLDGIVTLTTPSQTVTLYGSRPEQALAVITDGTIAPLLPIPDPDTLFKDVRSGQDITAAPPPTETLTLWADDRLLPILQEYAALFEQATGVAVQIEGMPLFDIDEQYASAFQAGTAPDLVTLPHQHIYNLINAGMLQPIEQPFGAERWIPATQYAFTYKGVLYGIPYAYDNLALVSNPEFVSGIPPTWTELRYYAEEIAAGREYFTSLMIPADGYFFYPVQSAFGGYIFGDFGDGTYDSRNLGLRSDGSLAAAQWLQDLVNFTPYFLGDEEQALQYFGERQVAMIVTGPWRLERLRSMGVPFQVNSFPGEVQPSQPFLSVYGFLINPNSPLSAYAQDFLIHYLTSYDAMRAYALALSAPPARFDVLEDLPDAELRAFGLAGVSGIPIPNLPEMDVVWTPWTDAIRLIIEGSMPAQEAFIYASDQIYKEILP